MRRILQCDEAIWGQSFSLHFNAPNHFASCSKDGHIRALRKMHRILYFRLFVARSFIQIDQAGYSQTSQTGVGLEKATFTVAQRRVVRSGGGRWWHRKCNKGWWNRSAVGELSDRRPPVARRRQLLSPQVGAPSAGRKLMNLADKAATSPPAHQTTSPRRSHAPYTRKET